MVVTGAPNVRATKFGGPQDFAGFPTVLDFDDTQDFGSRVTASLRANRFFGFGLLAKSVFWAPGSNSSTLSFPTFWGRVCGGAISFSSSLVLALAGPSGSTATGIPRRLSLSSRPTSPHVFCFPNTHTTHTEHAHPMAPHSFPCRKRLLLPLLVISRNQETKLTA